MQTIQIAHNTDNSVEFTASETLESGSTIIKFTETKNIIQEEDDKDVDKLL